MRVAVEGLACAALVLGLSLEVLRALDPVLLMGPVALVAVTR